MLVMVISTRYKVWLELTALESTAFRIREANGATASINCPRGTRNRKQVVAGQMALPAVVFGSSSYRTAVLHL
jgi:hypothetical protein